MPDASIRGIPMAKPMMWAKAQFKTQEKHDAVKAYDILEAQWP